MNQGSKKGPAPLPRKNPNGGNGETRTFRVLVVEDDADLRTAIRDFLSMHDMEVDVAEDGQKAAELVSGNRYDFIVTDYRMPKSNGIDVVREAFSQEHPPEVILISAYVDDIVRWNARELGVRHVLRKPVSLRFLTRLIRGY